MDDHGRQFDFDDTNQSGFFEQEDDLGDRANHSSTVTESPSPFPGRKQGTPPSELGIVFLSSHIASPTTGSAEKYDSDWDQKNEDKLQKVNIATPIKPTPLLYSAIGSLEDPGNGSYRMLHGGAATNKHFFSSTQLFIPPKLSNSSKYDDAATPATSNQRKKPIENSAKSESNSQRQYEQGQPEDSVPSHNETNLTNTNDAIGTTRSSIKDNTDMSRNQGTNKKVRINDDKLRKSRRKERVVEMFRPSSDAYTPRMGKKEIKYKPAEKRTPVQQMASPLGTLSRPNFRDALRRVSMIIRQHIVKIEKRFEHNYDKFNDSKSEGQKNQRHRREVDGLFHMVMKDEFSEERFITPTYKLSMVRVPMARMGMVCGLKRIRKRYEIPSEGEIYEFAHQLFKKVQLSSECSIVCLIYVERLMEAAKVPLLANTWRPIFMCGLLLASKVWQDLSSWNIEFASVYPQYSLDAINRLELLFLRSIKWELYISSSLYAKYYFALRSLVEKTDFRQRYNRMVGGVNNVKASTALKIEERTTMIKEEVLQQLSRSM